MLRTRLPGFRPPRLSYANVTATLALVVATSMGGAYAHGLITSGDIKNNAVKSRHIDGQAVKSSDLARNAVTTNRIKARAVTSGKLAPSARGARVVQYVAPGAIFDTATSTAVMLPGTFDLADVANGTWSVDLVRNDPLYLFPLGRSAPAGEGTGDGFYLNVDPSGVARVFVNAPSYGTIDSIRITRTVRTAGGRGALARQASPRGRTGG